MKKFILALVAILAVVLVAGCETPKADPKAGAAKPKSGKAIAVIGKETITVEDYQERVSKQNPYLRARFNDPAKRKEYLDSLVRNEVLFQESARLGYDKDADTQERMKNDTIQKMIKKEFDEKMKDSLVPADEVKKFYNEHLSDYNKPEAIWVKVIQTKDQQKAQAALKEAHAKAEDQNHFVELVKKYSEDDKTNKIGGDITYKTREEIEKDYGKELADAAFALDKISDVAAKVAGAKAGPFYVVRLQGKRPAQNRTLEQVESQLKNRLFYEKRNAAFDKWVADLITKAKVTRNDALLSEVKVEAPVPGQQPPGKQGPGAGHPGMKPEGIPPQIKIAPGQKIPPGNPAVPPAPQGK